MALPRFLASSWGCDQGVSAHLQRQGAGGVIPRVDDRKFL